MGHDYINNRKTAWKKPALKGKMHKKRKEKLIDTSQQSW